MDIRYKGIRGYGFPICPYNIYYTLYPYALLVTF